MEQKKIIKRILDIFNSAMQDIESLREFFVRSQKTSDDYATNVEELYSEGKKLVDAFDYILEGEDTETMNFRRDEVLKRKINEKLSVADFVEIEPIVGPDKGLRYVMTQELRSKPSYSPVLARQKFQNVNTYKKILVESVLSHIVVAYESFLSSIYELLLRVSPLIYFQNQTILLADVFNKNFENAVNEKFHNEIDSTMRDSISALKMIIEKENIDVDRYEKLIDPFSEVYYRRNAYIHTSGCVNKDYLKKVPEKFTKGLEEGKPLFCDTQYINDSIELLTKVIFSISFELLMKNKVSGKELTTVSNYFFYRLCDKEYSLCKYVYLAMSQYKDLEFCDRTVYRINYINSIKQLGETKKVENEIAGLDVSIATDMYKIAKECLTNNNESVYNMLCKTYPNSFDSIAIRDWPIFINFRETDYYERFKEQHIDEFNVNIIELPYALMAQKSNTSSED